MMQQLKNIIDNLKNDPMFSVRVSDENGNTIVTNKTGEAMTEETGSVEAFFNSLYDAGYTSIVVQLRKKNGTSWKPAGVPVPFTFTAKGGEQPQATAGSPTQTTAPAPDLFTGLGFPGGLTGGLNMMDVGHKVMHYPVVIQENQQLKQENKQLQDTILELKENAFKNQYSDAKAAGTNDLITAFVANADKIVAAFTNKAAAPVPTPGLGQPQPQSPIKKELVDFVVATDDNTAEYIKVVLMAMTNNEAFGNELLELLEKHNLIPKQP